jgi:hypothetical protein
MTGRGEFLERKRSEAWDMGIAHRESLVSQHMTKHGLQERPFLKDVIDELIEEV